MRLPTRVVSLAAVLATAAAALTGAVLEAGSAGATVPAALGPEAIGLHYIGSTRAPDVQAPGRYWPAVRYGSLRIWDDGTAWRQLEPQQGQWDPGALGQLDSLVNGATRLGKQVLLVLGQTPQWASSCPDRTSDPAYPPGNPSTTFFYGAGAGCEPSDYATWDAYVDFLLNRYGGHLSGLQVWDEANYATFWQSSGGMTSSTVYSAMAQLTLHTWNDVQAFNAAHGTRIAVVAPSLGARSPSMPRWLQSFLTDLKAIGGKVNALALQMYPATGALPESSLPALANARAVRDSLEPGVPIWDTELGFGNAAQGVLYGTAPLAQGLMARGFLTELSSGISRVYYYSWGEHGWSGLYLENPDGTLNNNGLAFTQLAAWLAGAHPYGCAHGTGAAAAIWTCRFVLGNGLRAEALWATTGSPTVTLPSGTLRLYTLLGGGRPATGGQRVVLGVSPVLVAGTFAI